MNGDAISDLLLAIIALFCSYRLRSCSPGMAVAIGLIGLAAAIGVLDFMQIAPARGPHNFASMVAACIGFPLLAVSVAWPNGAIALRGAASGRFVVLVGGVSVLVAMNLPLWALCIPGIAALTVLIATLRSGGILLMVGGGVLMSALLLYAFQWTIQPLNGVQQLHGLLAVSLLLLAVKQVPQTVRKPASSVV